jgi:hypothetical protein
MPPIRQLLSNADEAGDAVRQVIRAYHGSPYDFDKFSAAKIGTGEGAQSYGHGLYFAGNEETARHYKEALSDDAPFSNPAEAAADYLAASGGNRPMALKILRSHAIQPASVGYKEAEQANIIRQAYEVLSSNADLVPKRRAGRMYEVEIGHPETTLLDWDSPINQQPRLMRAMERIASVAPDRQAAGRMMEWLPRELEGEAAYHAIRDAFQPAPGRYGYYRSGTIEHKSRSAAEALLQEGIPGIRYLDQGSRSAGEGTRNYVMFPGTEDQIRILRKYGLMAPVAAGAASQYNGPQ